MEFGALNKRPNLDSTEKIQLSISAYLCGRAKIPSRGPAICANGTMCIVFYTSWTLHNMMAGGTCKVRSHQVPELCSAVLFIPMLPLSSLVSCQLFFCLSLERAWRPLLTAHSEYWPWQNVSQHLLSVMGYLMLFRKNQRSLWNDTEHAANDATA